MQKISIIGAGLVGSLLSAYLSQKGFEVHVYERRGDPREADAIGGRSINLALSDRGWKALVEVGLADEIQAITIPMYGRMIHDLEGNQHLQPYSNYGKAIFSVSRAELNRLMIDCADALPNTHYHFNNKCRKIDLNTGEIQIENAQTNALETIASDVLFGADGAFSNVRFSMQRTYRFNYSQSFLPHGYKELTIPPNPDGSFRMDKNALHIWPRKSFMLIALPNLDGSFTCTLFLSFEGVVSFEQLQTEADVQAFFQTHFPDAVPLMPTLIEDFFENPTSSLVTIRCNPWVKGKNIALIGDASHAIVPFYGQGMNSGFEDCSVLNGIIEAAGSTDDLDWPSVLETYQQSRIPDADAIAELALHNFIEMRDAVINPNFVIRKQVEKQLQEKYPGAYFPLYSMVTFSHLRYSKALAIGQEQDRFFNELYQIEDWENKWKAGDFDDKLVEWVKSLDFGDMS